MRNLVVCSDGTWNTTDQEAAGVPIPTNVVRIYNAVADTNSQGVEQVKYYHPGVGTDGKWWERLMGGAMGVGLDKNIISAYRWLAMHYQADDRVFLFGFSRGAFTVRSLAGMIGKCGLLNLEDIDHDEAWKRVGDAYHKGYRDRNATRADWASDWAFHKDAQGEPIDSVYFVGVWDTVGALGVPDDLAILNLIDDPKRFSFHDTKLSDKVGHARHAVALDEHRASFTPTLWLTDSHPDLKQIWFPGVHSDVGGGYPEIGLSNGALLWMVEEAEGCELGFHAGMRGQVAAGCNARDVLHDSASGAFAYLATQPRSVPPIVAGDAALHTSVLDRAQNPPITQAPYRETATLAVGEERTVNVFSREPWNETGVYLEAGGVYEFTAQGQWLDRNITCGPEGADDGNFQVGEIAYLAGTLWGKVENIFQGVTGNKAADFKGTRRHEDMPWFALVGAIANGGQPKPDGTPTPHQAFKIGNGCTLPATGTLEKGGYLYCYANDAWNFYDNNRGSVTVTIKRTT